jgi:hypothetical protein
MSGSSRFRSTSADVALKFIGRLFDYSRLLPLLVAVLVVGVASVGVSGSSGDSDDAIAAGISNDYNQLELHFEPVNSASQSDLQSMRHVNRYSQRFALPVSEQEDISVNSIKSSSVVGIHVLDKVEGRYSKVEKSHDHVASVSSAVRHEAGNETFMFDRLGPRIG